MPCLSHSAVSKAVVRRGRAAESSQSEDKGWCWVMLLLQCGVNHEQRGVWVCSPHMESGAGVEMGNAGGSGGFVQGRNGDFSGNGNLVLSRLLALLSGSFPRMWIHGNKNSAL